VTFYGTLVMCCDVKKTGYIEFDEFISVTDLRLSDVAICLILNPHSCTPYDALLLYFSLSHLFLWVDFISPRVEL
jgi:hypothetical protein